MTKKDDAFMATFKGVLGFLVVLTVVIFLMARLIGGAVDESQQGEDPMRAQAIAERLKPIGMVNIGNAPAPAPAAAAAPTTAQRSGKEIVGSVCGACHGSGVLGAPKIGTKSDWEPRFAQGVATLDEHAIKGFKAMPAKGGNPALSDDEVKKAVAYMLEESGIKVGTPSQANADQGASSSSQGGGAPATGGDGTQTTASGATPDAPAAQTSTDASAEGEAVYSHACVTCHGMGVAGAPKLGDKAAWQPRIAKGLDTLTGHAINGFQGSSGVMPPKGGYVNLSDAQVKAAVAYMVHQSQ